MIIIIIIHFWVMDAVGTWINIMRNYFHEIDESRSNSVMNTVIQKHLISYLTVFGLI